MKPKYIIREDIPMYQEGEKAPQHCCGQEDHKGAAYPSAPENQGNGNQHNIGDTADKWDYGINVQLAFLPRD